METEKYQGWTNYATWRVNLEIIDGWASYHTEEPDYERFDSISNLVDHLKDYCERIIEDQCIPHLSPNFILDYAMAFLDEVNWREIADSMVESYPQLMVSNV